MIMLTATKRDDSDNNRKSIRSNKSIMFLYIKETIKISEKVFELLI